MVIIACCSDGVGETQFGDVLRFELQAIRKACSSIEDFRPKITFVLVQKRHHTRLFPAQADKKDAATGNVLPGLLTLYSFIQLNFFVSLFNLFAFPS